MKMVAPAPLRGSCSALIAATTKPPGATRSGFGPPSGVGPAELSGHMPSGTCSGPNLAVKRSPEGVGHEKRLYVQPTAINSGALAGNEIAPWTVAFGKSTSI